MRYAACNEIAADLTFAETCELLARFGFDGVEIAPYTLADDPGAIDATTVRQARRAIGNAGLVCAGLHWLLRAPAGLHLVHADPGVRRRSWALLHALVDLCGELGGDVLVLGSGKQRACPEDVSAEAARSVLRDGLAALGDRCERAGVLFLLEALPARITNVINTLDQAEQLLLQVGHPRVMTMFDFHNCADETGSWDHLIRTYAGLTRHVHLNDRAGRAPSLARLDESERDQFAAAFRALRATGYRGWVSLEVFGPIDSAETALRETSEFLRWMERVTGYRTDRPSDP